VNVLLVEDDPTVSKIFTIVLERAGFAVTSVANAVDALAVLGQSPFHAIVCDLILPRAEGTTFYDELRSTFPDMAERVLFVTGWANEPKSRALLEHTGRPFLAKPVEATELVAAVRRITT
jgi:DNA-binding response OmpR family regulator